MRTLPYVHMYMHVIRTHVKDHLWIDGADDQDYQHLGSGRLQRLRLKQTFTVISRLSATRGSKDDSRQPITLRSGSGSESVAEGCE